MNIPLKNCMRVGLVHFMAFPEVIGGEGPVTETIQKVLDDGFFNVIEITRINDPETRREAKRMLDQSGFAVGFGAHPMLLGGGYNLNAEDDRTREQAVEVVFEAIDDADYFGASGCIVLTGKDPGKPLREKAKGLLIKSLNDACEYAREKSETQVLLEQFDRVEFGKNCLIGPIDEAIEIAQEILSNHDNFGLVIDQGHIPLLGEKPADIKRAAEYISHIHIGNCIKKDPAHSAYGDNHPIFGVEAGENGIDELREFLAMLMDIDYIGEGKSNVVSFEVKPFGGQSAEEIIDSSRETLEAAWLRL